MQAKYHKTRSATLVPHYYGNAATSALHTKPIFRRQEAPCQLNSDKDSPEVSLLLVLHIKRTGVFGSQEKCVGNLHREKNMYII